MALLQPVLTFVVDVALAAWLGVMAFFSFVGAPRAFAVFGDDGGAYVNDVFPRYYRVGVGLGAVATVAGLALGATAGFDTPVVVLAAGAAAATLLAGYSLGVLVPAMDAAGDDAFERYHRRTVLLNGLAMLAVGVGLLAAHVP